MDESGLQFLPRGLFVYTTIKRNHKDVDGVGTSGGNGGRSRSDMHFHKFFIRVKV